MRSENGIFGVVFYYGTKPAMETRPLAEQLVAQYLPSTRLTTDPDSRPDAPALLFIEESAPFSQFPVPDTESFKYYGRGLSAEQIETVQKTEKATQILLVMPKDDVMTMGRRFTELALDFAVQTGAFIYDSATRECFTREEWRKRRLETWPVTGIPKMEGQVTLHVYQPSEEIPYVRGITLGMEKFGLPDVVVERFPRAGSRSVGNLINLVCQLLAERGRIENSEREVFRIGDLRDPKERADRSTNLLEGATQEAVLALLEGTPQAGDPDNRLLELDFRHGKGRTEDERRSSILSAIWGSEDGIVQTTHNDEILAASNRAKARLPDLQKRFAAGLPPGSMLMVKAPFERDDHVGKEWMWVEVMQWPENGPIRGLLANEPYHVKRLRPGSPVTVKLDEVFDYILGKPDGTQEGNETGPLIEANSEGR